MSTLSFWEATFERAVKTFARSTAVMLVANATGLLDVDYVAVASVVGLAAVVSVFAFLGI